VLDETFVMNACKEDCCYVARDWAEDVRLAKKKGQQNTVARDYVLPGQYPHPLYSIPYVSGKLIIFSTRFTLVMYTTAAKSVS
jgi:hypothetical protein